MNNTPIRDKGILFIVALVVALFGAAFTYAILGPTIGFDDANITQVYGRNIAQGYGYVYNIGGERVEGSTSILWTLINVAAFMVSDRPEPFLSALCLELTALTIYYAGRVTQVLVDSGKSLAPLATCAAFLLFPGFFGWMVWSLMDTTLWICLITALFFALVRRNAKGVRPWLLICLISLLLPITRPEGIVLTTGLALIFLVRTVVMRDGPPVVALAIGLSGAVSAVCATLWRISYFGYPFPNTFYAKTSDDFIPQAVSGLKYILSYFEVGHNVLLVGLLCVAAVLIILHGTKAARDAVLITFGVLTGAVLLYALLGGDHFGAHRFLLLAIPLGLPVIMTGLRLIMAANGTAAPYAWLTGCLLSVPFVLVGAVSGRAFVHDQGGIAAEFRIAEDGRERGTILNSLPGNPVVGVITAGGVRMAYSGPVQDLLGLNWTVMAHAEPDEVTAQITNHTGFNQNIFWGSPPDIFLARTIDCPVSWVPVEGFLGEVTDHISQSAAFRDLYELACYQGLVFHVSKRYLQRLAEDGRVTPFDILPPAS
jgi:arabinofuranosyltransferase